MKCDKCNSELTPPLRKSGEDILLEPPDQTGFTDSRDGKFYKTVKIGGQVWMAENLNYAAKGSKCYEDDEANGARYGRLYNWETAKNACPAGWHLPSDEEWETLVNYVGGESTAGKKLKSTSGWNNNGNGTDDFGFSALAGGLGYSSGGCCDASYYGIWWSVNNYGCLRAFSEDFGCSYCCFDSIGDFGSWWSATEINASNAWNWSMYHYGEYVHRYDDDKDSLCSVRCVQNCNGVRRNK
jgi:uncharacterized protein (TIGR02145 family)